MPIKLDQEFVDALPNAKYFDVELRSGSDEPESVSFVLWDTASGGHILYYGIIMDIEEAMTMVHKAHKAGAVVLPMTEQHFFVLDHYYHLTDELRSAWMYNIKRMSLRPEEMPA